MARLIRLSVPFPACLTPAGVVIWLLGNITLDGVSLARHLVTLLKPVELLFGLNGVILVADVVARQGALSIRASPFLCAGRRARCSTSAEWAQGSRRSGGRAAPRPLV